MIYYILAIIACLIIIYTKRKTVWTSLLSDPWFDYVRTGRKTFEGRRYFDKWTKIQLGDTIVFKHYSDRSRVPFIRYVISIQKFPTFLEALEHFQKNNMLQQLLPGIKTPQEGAELYKKFVRLETQERDGVVILGLSSEKI